VPNFQLVLVGNKIDFERERVVSTEEGRQLAGEFECPFYEGQPPLHSALPPPPNTGWQHACC